MNAIAELDLDTEVEASVRWYETRWDKARGHIVAIGQRLIDDKRRLPPGSFTKMIEDRLPFSAWTARQLMRIASDPRVTQRGMSHALPSALEALDELRTLTDEQFEAGIGRGSIRPDMTVRDARELVRSFDDEEAKARREMQRAMNHQHRPDAVRSGPPTAPKTPGIAGQYLELVFLLVERRKALGMAQIDLDARAGWTEGYTSKLEIPHADDGRTATADSLTTWLCALNCGLQVVAL